MSDSEAQQISSLQQEGAVEQFSLVTGAHADTARRTLEACNWNIELAINMHVDSVECFDPVQVPSAVQPSTQDIASSSSGTVSSESQDSKVRAPIPPVRQVLVEDGYSPSFRGRPNPFSPVTDVFRDFQAEARWQEERQLERQRNEPENSKKKTLENLFRPPLDLLFRGSMELAREEGSKQNKWLMINVQNVQEFQCQVLNRDLWSHHAVKSIVGEHFIFWQVYHDSTEGQRYMQFYNVHQFPYIAILDPRTGELLQTYSTTEPLVFCDLITEFLEEHSSPHGAASSSSCKLAESSLPASSSSSLSPTKKSSPYEETEEMQLKAAIAASLQETSNHVTTGFDSDELETFDSDTEDSGRPETKEEIEDVAESYTKYLGDEIGKKSELIIRFPDGNREQVSFPADSQLKALFLYVSSQGYDMKEYDLVTNFPMRNLKELSGSETLQSVGLFPRETVYVRHKP